MITVNKDDDDEHQQGNTLFLRGIHLNTIQLCFY